MRFLSRVAAFLLLAYGLGYVWFAVALPRPAGDETTDAVVVLTGGSGRLERGFELLRNRRAPRMLISGVERTVRKRELAAHYDVDEEVMERDVDLGRDSFDTRSNADEVARWVQRRRVRSIRLVTNDLHMPRAHYEVRKRVGDDLVIVPDAVGTDPDVRQIYTEYNKYLLGRAADLIGI